MKKIVVWSGLFLGLLFSVEGQYVDSGQDPAFICWRQINSPHFQIIFPEQFELHANRLANALEMTYCYISVTLKHEPRKISVILHNYTVDDNADVLWAPKRVNFNTIPGQDIYPQIWLDQLAVHELRHVVQIDKMRQGFTKILEALFGQQATAGVFGAYIPFWLVEGDAVVSETGLSYAGRGRLPSFEMGLRAPTLEKKIYSYEKTYLGSYKDYVPDYYTIGYYLTALGRVRHGPFFWEPIFQRTARKSYIPWVFNQSLKKQSGQNKWKFYRTQMHLLDSAWRKQEATTPLTSFVSLNDSSKKVFTSYNYPQFLSEGRFLVYKTGFSQIGEFVEMDSLGREYPVFTPGFVNFNKLYANDSLIIWTEYNYDIRWSNRLYSDIVVYYREKKARKKFSRRRYLFAPELSPDGNTLVAVEATPDYRFSLVFFDFNSGREIKKIAYPGNQFLINPSWSEDGMSLVLIVLKQFGKSLEILDLESQAFRTLVPAVYQDISLPVWSKGYVYFHSTWNGVDNIYSVNTQTCKIFQITSSRFGAFAPRVRGSTLIYSDFTSMGYNCVRTQLDVANWVPFDSIRNISMKLYQKIAPQEKVVHFDSLQERSFESIPYQKWKTLFYLHSWAPISVQANSQSLNPGLTLLSQNKLSTSFATFNYTYNRNERRGGLSLDYTYKGIFPLIHFSGSSVNRSRSTSGERLLWNEKAADLTFEAPLNLTATKYSRGLIPSVTLGYVGVASQGNQAVLNRQTAMAAVETQFYNYRKQAYRDINTPWGQSVDVGLIHSYFGNTLYKPQFFIDTRFYFPGLIKHHSLNFKLGYQTNYSLGDYNFSNKVNYPRGFKNLYNRQYFSVFTNYLFPLLYPDFTIPGVIYIKRVYTNLFFDYSKGFNPNHFNNVYVSSGFELLSDIHFLSHILPFQVGFRFAWLVKPQKPVFQLLLNLNL